MTERVNTETMAEKVLAKIKELRSLAEAERSFDKCFSNQATRDKLLSDVFATLPDGEIVSKLAYGEGVIYIICESLNCYMINHLGSVTKIERICNGRT